MKAVKVEIALFLFNRTMTECEYNSEKEKGPSRGYADDDVWNIWERAK